MSRGIESARLAFCANRARFLWGIGIGLSTLTMSLATFEPSKYVLHVHEIPRFGHTNNIAHLASPDTSDSYKDGVVAMGILLCIIAVAWTLALVVLKLYYGTDLVGCAAGGQVVDVKRLKQEENLDKHSRKRRILRNWRVQTACLVASVAVLPVSMLFLRLGLNPVIESLSDMQEINDQVDSHAYRGILIVSELQTIYDNLQELLRSDLLSDQFTDEQFCPALGSTIALGNDNNSSIASGSNSSAYTAALRDFLPSTMQANVVLALESVDSILKRYDLTSATTGLYQATNATDTIDRGIESMYNHDWIIKFLVVIGDVVVIFLCFGILITKENTDYPAYQTFASWILLPIFCTILLASVSGTCVFMSMAMLNADFCAGGDGEGSPLGTMREVLLNNGFDAESLPYQAIDYYGSDCLTKDPFKFTNKIETTVSQTHGEILHLYSSLNSDAYAAIVEACGDTQSILVANSTLSSLERDLSSLRGTLDALVELTGCSSMSPVFRRLFFGSTCTQSIEGLASMYLSLLWISTLGFVILSTRAALFNPVIRGRRSKRREKEFVDYKEFMSKFYDTRSWQLDWVPDFDMVPQQTESEQPECHSDETGSTSTVSPTHSHDTNDNHTIVSHGSHDESKSELPQLEPAPACTDGNDDDDDSYDSTYSVDEGDDASTASFFSLAHFKKRIESIKPLGSLGSKTPHSQDEIVSSFSSSSVLNKFIRRRHGTSLGGDPLGRYQPDRHASEWNDDEDSNEGVLLTPPAMRYPMHLQHQSRPSRRGVHAADDPEMEPLSPPEQQGAFESGMQEDSKQKEPALTFRRSVYR